MPEHAVRTGVNRIVQEHIFEAPVSFAILPTRVLKKFKGASATLNLANLETVKFTNASAVTYSAIKGGQNGQRVLLLGDGQTTIQNNAKIKTYTGANVLLAADTTYELVFIDIKWYLRP